MPSIGMQSGNVDPKPFSSLGQDELQGEYELYEEEEVDEITINWGKLIARIISLFLVLCICILSALGGIDRRFYALAGIVFVASLIVFGVSFLDMDKCKTRTVNIFTLDGRISGARPSKTSTQDQMLP